MGGGDAMRWRWRSSHCVCNFWIVVVLVLHLLGTLVHQPGRLREPGFRAAFVEPAGFHRCGRRQLRAFARCHRKPADVLQDLEEYRSANGALDIAADYITADGFPLGKWSDNQRRLYVGENMSDDQFKLLNDLGFVWDLEAAAWADAFKDFEAQRMRTPRFLPEPGAPLHRWLAEQCALRLQGQLGPVRERRLCDVGFDWLLSSSEEEDRVVSFLAQAGLTSGLHYGRRQAVYVPPRQIGSTTRSKVFPDFTIYTEWWCVLLEVDEFQHEGGGQEDVQKMQGLIEAAAAASVSEESSERQSFVRGGRVHIVRYNPHSFSVDTLLGSHAEVSAAELHRRMKLIEAIRYVPHKTVEISYLFFDEVNGWPKISQRASYPLDLRQWIRRVFSLQLPRSVHGAP
jgi:hypothetical protein